MHKDIYKHEKNKVELNRLEEEQRKLVSRGRRLEKLRTKKEAFEIMKADNHKKRIQKVRSLTRAHVGRYAQYIGDVQQIIDQAEGYINGAEMTQDFTSEEQLEWLRETLLEKSDRKKQLANRIQKMLEKDHPAIYREFTGETGDLDEESGVAD